MLAFNFHPPASASRVGETNAMHHLTIWHHIPSYMAFFQRSMEPLVTNNHGFLAGSIFRVDSFENTLYFIL